jgi:hypothetical protein
LYACCFRLSKADAVALNRKFNRITHGSFPNHGNGFPIDDPHFHEPASQYIISQDFGDFGSLALAEFVETHGSITLTVGGNDKDVRRITQPQADSPTFDANQTRLATTHHANVAALPNTQFFQTLNLARAPAHFDDGALGVAGQEFNREGDRVSDHKTTELGLSFIF